MNRRSETVRELACEQPVIMVLSMRLSLSRRAKPWKKVESLDWTMSEGCNWEDCFVQLFPSLELPQTWSWTSSTSSTSLFPLVPVSLVVDIHLRLLFLVAWSRRSAFVPIFLYNISLSPSILSIITTFLPSPSLLCISCVLFLSNGCIVQ